VAEYRHENWPNVSAGRQNLAEVRLLSGRLAAGLRAGDEALCVAERADDMIERMASYALRGHARAQRGETDAALTDFQDALCWQHHAEGQTDRPLYSLRGVFHALLLTRLGRHDEALRLTEANKEVLLRYGGPQDEDIPKCHLILADLARQRDDFKAARDLCRRVHAWALERDAKEILCWSALVLARIELDEAVTGGGSPRQGTALQPLHDRAGACHQALTDGLQLARACGYGIYHIDLLLVQARLAPLMGDSDTALAAVETVLTSGYRPSASSSLPRLLAATHPECGYAWGEAEARHLRAEALLLQAAQHFGVPDFVPAKFDELPDTMRWRIEVARDELSLSLALRQRIHDPNMAQTADVLHRLNHGELLR
jgi:tetratricopeptide (TPR) repeat protein